MRAKATSECNSVRSPKPILGSRSGAIRSSTNSTGPIRMWCCAPAMHRSSRRPNARSRTCWSECGEHNQRLLSQQRSETPRPKIDERSSAVHCSRSGFLRLLSLPPQQLLPLSKQFDDPCESRVSTSEQLHPPRMRGGHSAHAVKLARTFRSTH